jgi:hypothetical protein
VPLDQANIPPLAYKGLRSGRRVKGREAVAYDAVDALDAAAVIGTLIRRGRRLRPATGCLS